MADNKITTKMLRSFGLIVGAGFGIIALVPTVFRHQSPRPWALAVSGLLIVTALILPIALKPVFRGWMAVGEVLGWVNTRIILIVVYYGVIVPVGAMMRLTGTDPMRLKFEPQADSYRIVRVKRPASHMHRQY